MSQNQNLPRQANFKITTIGGKRCTAVPRANSQAPPSQAASSTPQAPANTAPVTTTARPPPPPPSSSPEVPNAPIQESAAPTSAVLPPPAPSSTTEPVAIVNPAPPLVTTTRESTTAALETTAIVTTSTVLTTQPTPEAILGGTTSAIIQTVSQTPPTPSSNIDREGGGIDDGAGLEDGGGFGAPGNTGLDASPTQMTSLPNGTGRPSPEITSGAIKTVTNKGTNIGPIVGGVAGAVAIVAMLAILFLFCRRRRKRKDESFNTPLSTGIREKFYEIDQGSVGPTSRGTKWRNAMVYRTQDLATRMKVSLMGIGLSLKSKVPGVTSGTPSVNLDRGNSQFFHTPIPQHSRNNSSATIPLPVTKLTLRERFEKWGAKLTGKFVQKKEDELVGPFTEPRPASDGRPSNEGATFTRLVAVDNPDPQRHRRQSSITALPTLPQIDMHNGTFGDALSNPFADPKPIPQNQSQQWRPRKAADYATDNPFADPIPAPAPSAWKPQTYIEAVRRSRGNSHPPLPDLSANSNRKSIFRPISSSSRYPSTIAPSIANESDRDTMFSYFNGGRKGKGRSDPFDLERPELRKPQERTGPPLAHQTQNRGGARANVHSGLDQTTGIVSSIINQNRGAGHTRNSSNLYPNPLRMNTDQPASTHARNQRNRGDSLGGWEETGPDFGNGSINSSLRGNASSRGGSSGYDDFVPKKGELDILTDEKRDSFDDGSGQPRWKMELGQQRKRDNVSPVSALSVDMVGRAT